MCAFICGRPHQVLQTDVTVPIILDFVSEPRLAVAVDPQSLKPYETLELWLSVSCCYSLELIPGSVDF